MLPNLYPHQSEMVDRVRKSLAKHGRSILCASPGVGKTRMAKFIIGSKLARPIADNESGGVLFTVHRRGLVDNASESFYEDPGLDHGIIMSGRKPDWSQRLHVASIDTMRSWYAGESYNSSHTFDLVIFDESHSHLGKLRTWFDSHNDKRSQLGLKPAYLLGLSATPACKGIGEVFRDIVKGPTKDWLIENGFLSPFRYVQATQGRTGLLVKRGNEFTDESIDSCMEGLAGNLIDDWKRFGQGRPTVGFFHRLVNAQEATVRLQAAGINAEYLDGETSDDKRRNLFAALNCGDLDYICNVGIVERGTNIPGIACVQLCTAIGSRVRFEQMIGRGSRTAEGKADCIVIDHAGNIKRHGFFEDEIEWTLAVEVDAVKDFEAKPAIKCPMCERVYRGGACVCGYEPTKSERKAQGLEFDGRELVEISRKPKAESVKKKTCEELMIAALYRAGKSGRTWKQAVGIAKRMAEEQGTRFRVPRAIEVAGREYRMIPYGDPDCGRRVSALYGFTVGNPVTIADLDFAK